MGQLMPSECCREPIDTEDILTIWGDYINSETRAILAAVHICNESFQFKYLNTLADEHQTNLGFSVINPIREVPLIVDGKQKIVGGPVQFMTYLCSTRLHFTRKLYPKDKR